jgi:hypothetical protein
MTATAGRVLASAVPCCPRCIKDSLEKIGDMAAIRSYNESPI